jgi:hypothetical protein
MLKKTRRQCSPGQRRRYLESFSLRKMRRHLKRLNSALVLFSRGSVSDFSGLGALGWIAVG